MNEMNEKMIIKVLPAEGSNPEFEPDEELQKGIECYGYVLMTFNRDHELETAMVGNLSMKNISDAVIENCTEDAVATIRSAIAVAEGYIRGANIMEDHRRDQIMKHVKNILRGMEPDEFPEDEIQDFPEEE